MSVLGAARFYYFHMHHYTGVPEDPDRFVSTWVDYPNNLFDPAEGPWVAVEAKGKGRYKNGNPYDQDYCYLIEMHGERIRALRQYFDSHYVATQMGVEV